MLFLINKAGVPSVASWVRIDPGAPDRALTDTKAPKVKITKKPKRKSGKRKAKFRFKASERGSSFECKVDGKKFRRCDDPVQGQGRERVAQAQGPRHRHVREHRSVGEDRLEG